jgi:glycosyltransferase involved in cell wall biosynthesis
MQRSILLVTDLYAPVTGGLEGHVRALGRALVRRGHRVTVATFAQPGQAPREDDGGVEVRRIDGWSRALLGLYEDPAYRFHPPAPDPGVVRALAAIVRDVRPDVIHAHAWMLYSALGLRASRRSAVLMTLHDYGLACAKKTFVRHDARCTGPRLGKCLACAPEQYGVPMATALVGSLRASRFLHRRVDRFLAVSARVREAVATTAGGRPIDVVPNFLAADVAAIDRRERPSFLPESDGFIFYAGALTRNKGVDVLVRASELLGDDAPPLVLVGRPSPGLELPARDRLVVVPGASREDVLRSFARCAVAVIPSVWDEPCPTVAMEAMSCGRPVVASRIGGLPELVPDGVAGLLVPERDERALADAISALLRDDEQRERLGAGALVQSRRYAEEVVVDRIEAAYEETLDEIRGRRRELGVAA